MQIRHNEELRPAPEADKAADMVERVAGALALLSGVTNLAYANPASRENYMRQARAAIEAIPSDDSKCGAARRVRFIAQQIDGWLAWSKESRSREHLDTDGATKIMALPVASWPTHVQFWNWIKALNEAALMLDAMQIDAAISPTTPQKAE